MPRPYAPKTLLAVQDYALRNEEGYVYTLKEIAQKHGVTVPALSRAAHKHGLSRRKEAE